MTKFSVFTYASNDERVGVILFSHGNQKASDGAP